MADFDVPNDIQSQEHSRGGGVDGLSYDFVANVNMNSDGRLNVNANHFSNDQFLKHTLKAKHYIRYADDFVMFSRDREWLEDVLLQMKSFLLWDLKLQMHPNKVSIGTLSSGVDFLGWVHFPNYRVLRTATKRRMFRNLALNGEKKEVVQSYLGLLKWGNGWKLREEVERLTSEK